MKAILIACLVVVIAGGVLGYYLGWFNVSTYDASGQANITLSVDKDKIAADKNKAVGKAQEMGHDAANAVAATTQEADD